ncbi:LamG-like jellyroll fold domain-containing protein [Zunongwangia sp. F260]|uniref:LamG-like jellyroll fold domain-containing protein n=1 Tax=Autumnicola lenta TaxID=3075593 RepID=A0ABU3CMS7_9FLAO|nr:T9SS type A sorting domain-containing protein [Zunongwangia sp. F260]MDT0647518.1 LamG-like jellyroll fold domain-containing protein [Zunongwangia sp. F260]
MVKNLLFPSIWIILFFLAPMEVVGQCPTSVGVTANPGTIICAGESITFTANQTGGSLLQYQWLINGNEVENETNPTFTISSLTNGQRVRVRVTSSSGGQTNCPALSSEVPITVNPIRTVSATISANNSNICPSQTVSFTISSQSNIGSGSQYEWRVNGTSQGTSNTFSSSSLVAGDNIQLWVDSSVPCTDPILSNTITISEKAGPPATPGTVSGETTICPGSIGLVYQISSVANATSYEWQLPSGWSGTSTTNSITVTSGNTGNATIKVRAKNECGNSEFQTLDVTVQDATPSQPGAISGPTSVCPGVSADYSISAVARATEYIWTLPDGSTQTTTAPNISVTTNTSGSSNISVQAKNTCGSSTKKTLNVSLKPGKPATPATITGNAAVCPGISQTYSVAAVTGATSYAWTLPTGWTGTSTSRSISVNTGTAGGNISVIAMNDCDDSDVRELSVTVDAGTPAVPEFISPLTDVCPGVAETFTVNEVAGATRYIWTLPNGWSGTSTTNTISITSANSGTGSISVQSTNGCGTSAKKAIQVAIRPPSPTMTATIQGPNNVCASTAGLTFTIPDVQYATEYVWSAPGWNITNGQGSRTVTVTSGTGAGTISVKAKNDCGESVAATKNITVTSGVPANPGTITSSLGNNTNICPPSEGITFTVSAVTGATGYSWSLPAGWEITAGANTRSITVRVTANARYQDENVSVRATNVCGQSVQTSTFSDIRVNNFILTNVGQDKTVCRVRNPISIDVQASFGSSDRLTPNFTSTGTGAFGNVPPGNKNIPTNYTITYTPSAADTLQNSITITLKVPPPTGGGSNRPCGTGEDQMIISFKDSPTASIATPAAICTGSSTNLTITGTPNSRVTYRKGTQTGLTVDIGTSGTATIASGNLTANTVFTLTGITNLDSPTCSNTSLSSAATVTVTQTPTATISYAGPYCKSLNTAQTPTLSGTNAYTGGTFTATGDLASKINTSTGAFTPTNVAAGTYTVTYTIPAAGGCPASTATTEITITPLPTAAIAYESSPFCSSDSTDKLVTLTGTNAYTGGTYSSTNGLDLNASTGLIKAASSTPGNYTVTYSLPAAAGCGVVTATTQVTVTEIPVPVISYTENQICKEDTNTYNPAITGTGIVTGGTFSAPSGLNITSAGIVNPSASTPGTYKVTYTLAPANGCSQITAENEITITPVPSVEISYAGPFCESTTGTKQVILANGTGAFENGSYSVTPAGLTINSSTGAITPSTSNAGEYNVTYTIPSGGGCESKVSETTVKITAVPRATISYPDAAFCSQDVNTYNVTYSNTDGNFENGTFTGTAGLIIDSSTGAITPEGSTPGPHTITYTIPTADGCEAVTTAVNIDIIKPVEITAQPFNVGKCAGETARLEVVAQGNDLTYQWFKDGAEVPGATSAILEYSPVDPDDAAQYYVEVSGSSPCSSVTSETVSLIVDQNIEVDSTPEDKELCVGDSASFTVDASANGGAVEYQWMRNGVELEGRTNSSLVLENISLEDEGEYTVFLEGPEGFTCSTITYTAGSLDVFEKPVPNAGNNITACYSEGAIAITDGASVTNSSAILWEADGTGTINNADELTGATYTPGPDETGTITLILTAFGNSTCTEVEVQKTLQIERLPVISAFSYSAVEFCETDSVEKEPILEGNNAFQNGSFYVTPANGLSITADGRINPSDSDPGTYQIKYSTPAGTYCYHIESEAVTVVIGLEPIADFSYNGSIYCRDTRDASQNVNPIISLTEARGENFDTFIVIDATGTVITNSGLDLNAETGAINLSNSAAGDYIIQRTLNYTDAEEDGCVAVTAEFPITISDKPIADFSYSSSEYCSDVITNPVVQLATGAVAGTFSEKDGKTGLVFSNTSTGEINIATSIPGEYIIVNTVDIVDDGCDPVYFEFPLTITRKSDATFTYTKQDYCITDQLAAVSEGFEAGGTFSSLNNTLGNKLNASTGNITWTLTDNSIAGSHTIIYKIAGKGSCEDVEHSFTINIDPIPQGGKLSFGTFGNMFVICDNPGTNYAVDLALTESVGRVAVWKYRTSTATTWSDLMIDGALFTGTMLPAAVLEDLLAAGNMESMVFRVQLGGGGCSATVFSETGIVSVISANIIKPTPVTVSDEVICIGDEITLSSTAEYLNGPDIADGGAFYRASITRDDNPWRINRDPNGQFQSSANNTKPDIWERANPRAYSTADITSPYTVRDNIRWESDGQPGFAIVSGNRTSTLETPIFNIDGFDQAILTFDQAFNLTPGASIRVEISTNGGSTYLPQALYERTGPMRSGNFGNFSAGDITTRPNNKIRIDLGNYMGQGNLRIQFKFVGARVGDVWALDNIDIPDGPRDVSTVWTDYTDPNNPVVIGRSNTETWEPTKIGLNTFEVQRFMIYNSAGDECENTTPPVEVEVFVYDSYTSTPSAASIACGTNSFNLSVAVTGGKQGSINSYPTADGFIGHWEVVNSPEGYSYNEAHFSGGINNPTAVFTPNVIGSFTVRWNLELEDANAVSECENVINEIDLNIYDKYASTATATVEACGINNISLEGTMVGQLHGAVTAYPTPDGTYGEWQVISSPTNYSYSTDHFSDLTDPSAVFTPNSVGDYILRWAIINENNTGCEHTMTNVTVTLYDSYTSTATAALDTCENNSYNLNATVTGGLQGEEGTLPTPDGTTGFWEVVESPTGYTVSEGHFVGGSSNPNAVFTPVVLGEYTLQWNLVNQNLAAECLSPATVSFKLFDSYTLTAEAEAGSCGNYAIQLTGTTTGFWQTNVTFPTQDGYIGQWRVEGGAGNFSNSDPADPIEPLNNPDAIFTATGFGTYTFYWELIPDPNHESEFIENTSCPAIAAEVIIDLQGCTALDFDGLNDRVLIDHAYPDVMSIEAWIRPKETGGTIISGPNFRITTPADVVPNSRWYHIAVSNGKLYIDGVDRSDLTLGNSAGSKTVIGAEIINGEATNFFHGWIEEVRLWKRALTVEQIQFMMNQRLIDNGAQMGEQIPMDAPGGLTYADLAGYYRLISANPDPAGLVTFDGALMPVNGETANLANAAIPGRLINMETNQENTAPLPYFSGNNGMWGTDATWARPNVWDPPHTGPIEWNIARISHNINSGSKDITVLGLLSDSGELTIANPSGAENENNSGQFLNITHYLLLNGNIDLVGESQLLQGEVGILDESSAGWLERDQQGTRSSFNYNYWSSPVSLQGEANNSNYTIAQVLRDGTDSNNPQIINFRPGHNAADNARTNAVTVSEYWLWRFNGTSDVYEEWIHIGSSGTLRTGEGFTMKGTDGNADIEIRQNYVFKGKPHNGDFTLPVGMDKNYLIGNPYPSAIDAREFILDNLNGDDVSGARNTRNVFNGVVYFWDHFAGHTHILREYVGGYAALTLAGAVPAVSIDERINANEESGTKTPQQYIPVGQGFFINTGLETTSEGEAGNSISVDAGNIEFKNSQRETVRETSDNSIFLKPIYPSKKTTKAQDERAKIRLRFDSPKGYHRQILVAADPITTDNVDLGYDAPLIEYNLDDMYWIINQREYVIQAVPDFGKERILPLGVQLEEKGNFTIAIDSRENLGEDHKIYLQDKLRDSIHDFKDGPYKEESESGFIDERFSIVFHKKEVPVPGNGEAEEEEEESIFDAINIAFKHSSRELKVYNPDLINISHVILFDLTGKKVQEFNNIATEKEVTLPVVQFPSSVYIVKLFSDKRTHNKKILMK